jgi:hypothetical protein
MKHALAAAALVAVPSVASAQPVVSSFNPFAERDAQRAAVGAGRTVVTDFNDPLDYAGKIIFCDETAPGSKIFVPKGNGRFEGAKETKFEDEELDDPRRTRRVVVAKGGEVSGWGATVGGGKRRLVEVSTYESARAVAPASLTADQLKLANEQMALAGGEKGEYACYIWSVSEMTTRLIVDEEAKFSANTPAVFVVAAKFTFLRNALDDQRDEWATLIMTPFKLSGPAPAPVEGATFAPAVLKEATPEEQAAADRIAKTAEENMIVEQRAEDAGIVFSQPVKDKFDKLTAEELKSITTTD